MIYTSRCTKGCRLRLFLRADVKWHLSVVTFLLLFPPMLWTFIAWTLSSLFLEQGKGRGELGNPHQIERMLSISIDRFDRVDAIVKGTGIGILWRFECNVCDYTQLFCDGGAWDSGLDSFRLVVAGPDWSFMEHLSEKHEICMGIFISIQMLWNLQGYSSGLDRTLVDITIWVVFYYRHPILNRNLE